ncbi:neprilysin-like [Physella acuta]|uniref:neprilysin-like n=1 Tax=Physella acuta TaxID=109671 RepID=UPI0027DAF7FE|nr:neprilysin-like [Physella acuta]
MNLYRPLFVILFYFFVVGCIALFVFTAFKVDPKKEETPTTNAGENVCEGPDCGETFEPTWGPITDPTPAPLPTGDTTEEETTTPPYVCEGAICNAITRMMDYMDKEANPCLDFYEYACGGWRKRYPLQDHEIMRGPVFSLIDKVAERLKDLLSSQEAGTDKAHMVAAKSYFAACINTDKIKERGAGPMLNLLRSMGSFPGLDSAWTQEAFDLTRVMAKFDAIGLMPLIRILIEKSELNNNEFTIHVGVPMTDEAYGVLRPGREEKPLLEEYYTFLGINETTNIDAIIDLNKKISDAVGNMALYTAPKAVTVLDLGIKHPWVNWTQFLQARFDEVNLGLSVKDDTTVILMREDYMNVLESILNSTSKRVLAEYLLSRTQVLSTLVGREYLIPKQDLEMEKMEIDLPPRWRMCVNDMLIELPDALGRMYVEKYYPNFNKQPIETMAKALRDSFKELIQTNFWLSDATKAATKESLLSLTFNIGYPDYIFQEDKVELYEFLKGEAEYFEAKLACSKRLITDETRRLKPNYKKWILSAASVDVVYDPDNHDITIPVGILEEPFYNPEYSSSMNYGGIGFIIGHEITDTFKIASPGGNDSATYQSHLECLKKQFSSYTWGEYNVNGELTLSDNLADQGGLLQSYLALHHLNGGNNQKLPGLDLEPTQVFFLNFAQGWCSLYRDDVKKTHIDTDMHAPHEVRIRGMTWNSREFFEVFSCIDDPPYRCNVF